MLDLVPPKEEASKRFLLDLCEEVGIDHAAYLVVHPQEARVTVQSAYLDEWVEHYIENKLFLTDPIVSRSFMSSSPIDWLKLRGWKRFRKSANDAQDFGLVDTGVTVSVCGPGGELGMLSVSRHVDDATWVQHMHHVLPHLQVRAAEFHELFIQHECLKQGVCLNLTGPELDLLHWSLEGKGGDEIEGLMKLENGELMRLAASVMRKLNARTFPQAIGRAMGIGIISMDRPAFSKGLGATKGDLPGGDAPSGVLGVQV